jgi:hypothetical protein
MFCAYPEGTCNCGPCADQVNPPVQVPCDAGTPNDWGCSTLGAGCPVPRPHVGTSCATADLSCWYGETCENAVTCRDGTWHVGGVCVASSRRFKRDIAYLTDAEIEAMADEALSLKLARWRYDGARDDGNEHVGFIIEDSPHARAVTADGAHVDLYTYATMAVAAAQRERRDVERLESELRKLRRELAELHASCR